MPKSKCGRLVCIYGGQISPPYSERFYYIKELGAPIPKKEMEGFLSKHTKITLHVESPGRVLLIKRKKLKEIIENAKN